MRLRTALILVLVVMPVSYALAVLAYCHAHRRLPIAEYKAWFTSHRWELEALRRCLLERGARAEESTTRAEALGLQHWFIRGPRDCWPGSVSLGIHTDVHIVGSEIEVWWLHDGDRPSFRTERAARRSTEEPGDGWWLVKSW